LRARRGAALVVLLFTGCSFDASAPSGGSAPGRAADTGWLRRVDPAAADLSEKGPVTATGHVKGGGIEMSAGAVRGTPDPAAVRRPSPSRADGARTRPAPGVPG
jgi:hypothetical protein